MDELGSWFAHELEMISQAPVFFLTAVAAVGFAIWKVIEWHFQTRLENAASTNKLLEDRLQDYKDKLSGATPEEARARMDALEARIEALGPRRIDGNHRREMIPHLDPFRGTAILIASDGSSADAAGMKGGVSAAFGMAGWVVTNSTVIGLGNPPRSGIGLTVEDPANLTPPQHAIVSAFRAANVPIDIQRGVLAGRGRPDQPPPAAEIVLTTRADG